MNTDTDTAEATADAVAAPLDLLLTDAAFGALRLCYRVAPACGWRPRWPPGPGSSPGGDGSCSVRWPASPWAARMSSRPGGTAGSPTRAGWAIRCCAAWSRPTSATADGGGCGRGRGPGLGRPGAGRVRPAQPGRRGRAEQQPDAQPGSAEDGYRHWRQQRPDRRAPLRLRYGRPATGAIHGRTGRVRGRRGPGRHAGDGGAADPGVRADPVPADHGHGPASPVADRPADHQQVLHNRPGARPQHGRIHRRQRPAGIHDVLAQPGRQAREMGLRHLRAGRPRRHGRRHADRTQRAGSADGDLFRWHHRRDGRRAPRAQWPTGPDRRVHAHGHRAG